MRQNAPFRIASIEHGQRSTSARVGCDAGGATEGGGSVSVRQHDDAGPPAPKAGSAWEFLVSRRDEGEAPADGAGEREGTLGESCDEAIDGGARATKGGSDSGTRARSMEAPQDDMPPVPGNHGSDAADRLPGAAHSGSDRPNGYPPSRE